MISLIRKNKKLKDQDMFWSVNPNSNICFVQRRDIINIDNQPDSFWTRPKVVKFILLACATLDFCMFYQLFSATTNDSFFIRIFSTFAAIIGFDVIPIYFGYCYRKHIDGFNINKLLFILSLTVFTLVFFSVLYLRYELKDVILSGSAYTMSGISTTSSNSNPASTGFFIFCSISPVATSIASFMISYLSFNPLKQLKQSLEKQIDAQKAKITQFKSILLEYEADQAFKSRIIIDEKARFYTAAREAQEKGIYLCDYVRERIKEHLGDSSSISELSKPSCIKIIDELEQTKRSILDIQPVILYQDIVDAENDKSNFQRYSA